MVLIQSITDNVLLNFWLMLFCWMFIWFYTTIYFFVKKFMFLNNYISVNTKFECLYMFFWLRNGPSIKYVRYWWGNGESSKMRTAVYRGSECHASCLRTHLHYLFSCFWQHFCLKVSCFIFKNLTLPLLKKDVFVRNSYFSPTRSASAVMK